MQQDSAKLLNEARREADGIVTRARADADRFREEMKQQASAQATQIVERAQKEIERETARAVGQLRQEAVNLSFTIASKVLRREVTRVRQRTPARRRHRHAGTHATQPAVLTRRNLNRHNGGFGRRCCFHRTRNLASGTGRPVPPLTSKGPTHGSQPLRMPPDRPVGPPTTCIRTCLRTCRTHRTIGPILLL